jgi:hypothetical protein
MHANLGAQDRVCAFFVLRARFDFLTAVGQRSECKTLAVQTSERKASGSAL